MRRFLITSVLLLTTILAVAQNADSLTFVSAKWKIDSIAKGLVLKRFHFVDSTLFKSNQYISILEVSPSLGRVIEILPSPVLIETSTMAVESNALAAINGSFFKFNYTYNTIDYNSVDYIRIAEKVYSPNTYKNRAQREINQKGAIAILKNQLYILKADVLSQWEDYINADQIISSGPTLIINKTPEALLKSSFYITRHPRTLVVKTDNNLVLLITIDGRAKQSAGLTLEESQKISIWLGAESSINLDGGGSTTMYVKGLGDTGVVNHPTDNKLFDNKGERKVANAIIIK